MTEDPFDRLLDAMPKIAQVVNEFSSEEVQRRAFDALLATLGATVEAPPPDPQDTNGVANGAESGDVADDVTVSAATGTAEISAGRSRRSTWNGDFLHSRRARWVQGMRLEGSDGSEQFAAIASKSQEMDRHG